MTARVFLSYASKDAERANTTCRALEEAGIGCWIAPRDVGAGDYGEAIIRALEAAELVVVLLSARSNESVHVRNEVERASSKGKTIVTLRIEEVMPARRLELFLSSQQWVDAWNAPFEARLADLVDKLLLFVAAEQSLASRNPAPSMGATQLTRLLQRYCWIGYDPTNYDPDRENWPTVDSLRGELRHIQAAGFSGIVTFGCRETLALIPELARELGLAVISGVWDPRDEAECERVAALRNHVDAYCLGHNGLGSAYQKHTLYRAMQSLAASTGRPVATTEEIRLYRQDDDFCRAGDWLFPDGHVSLRPRPGAPPVIDVERNVASYISLAAEIVKIAVRHDRPLMLKMVTFPWAGAEGASLEKQAQFFALLLEALRDPEAGLSGRVAMMYSSAFDLPWKTGHPFYAWDAFTGLLDHDGRPRPAVEEILSRRDRIFGLR